MHALIGSILAQAEEHGEEVSEAKDLYPAVGELVVGLLAFAVLFFFTWKWVLPKFKEVLEQRREQIQGEMEKAEATRKEADKLQRRTTGRSSPAPETKRTASSRKLGRRRTSCAAICRRKPRRNPRRSSAAPRRRSGPSAIGCSRSSGPRSDRSRWRSPGRVVGQSLDEKTHQRLIDEFIDEVASGAVANGNGNAKAGDAGSGD